MDMLSKLSKGAKLTLGTLVLYVIDSLLFHWQTFRIGPISASINEWHGVGVIAGLCGLALLVWEAMPLFMPRPSIGRVHPRLISVVLAGALVLFTLIRVLSTYVGWSQTVWSWLGLVLAVVAAYGAVMQMRDEGLAMSDLKELASSVASAAASATAQPQAPPPAAGAAPNPPDESAASAEDAAHS